MVYVLSAFRIKYQLHNQFRILRKTTKYRLVNRKTAYGLFFFFHLDLVSLTERPFQFKCVERGRKLLEREVLFEFCECN